MELREAIRNPKRPYADKERFLKHQASMALDIINADMPEDVITAYANINSSDPEWRKWSEETIAGWKKAKSDSLMYYDQAMDKLAFADKHTNTFHFQIAICVVAVGFFLMAVIAR